MNRNKKITNTQLLTLTLVMSIFLSFLTGCVDQTVTVSVAEDDRVSLNVKVTIDKDKFQQIEVLGIDEPKNAKTYGKELLDINPFFRKMANKYVLEDMEVSPINDSFEIGFVAFKTLSSIDEFNAFIAHLFDENLSPLEGEIKKQDLKVIKRYKFDGNLKYVIDEDVLKAVEEFSESDMEIPGLDKDDLLEDLLSGNSIVEVKFPADVKTAYGFDEDEIGNNPVFKNTMDEDIKPIGLGAQYLNKQGAAILLTIGFLVFVVLMKNLFTNLISKRRR